MTSRGTIFGARQVEQQQPSPKPRKTRSDKKTDIKFKLSASEKKQLKILAKDHGLSLTAFASRVVTDSLGNVREYESAEYDHAGTFVHVMLGKQVFDVVQDLSIEWDIPFRHVAYRIVKDYLLLSEGVPKVNYYKNRGV